MTCVVKTVLTGFDIFHQKVVLGYLSLFKAQSFVFDLGNLLEVMFYHDKDV